MTLDMNVKAVGELLERVKAATGPDSSLDVALLPLWAPDHDALKSYDDRYETEFRDGGFSAWEKDGGFSASSPFPRFTASVDAALALVERVLPGWRIELRCDDFRSAIWTAVLWSNDLTRQESIIGPTGKGTASLAILAALLSALQVSP